MKRNIILFANWGLGHKVLLELIKNGFPIEAVVTQFNPSLEKEDPYFNIVYNTAKSLGVKIFSDLKELRIFLEKKKKNLLGVSVAFNKIIPQSILDKIDIINLHPSLIPYYRGVSPIEHQIKNKENYIGLTLHFMTSQLDWGEIVAQEKIKLNYNWQFNVFLDKLNEFAASFLVENLKNLKKREYYNFPNQYMAKTNKRLKIPKSLYKRSLSEVSKYLNLPRMAVFTGNRAEFGILYPFLLEASNFFQIDLYVSGAHIMEGWGTIKEIKEKIEDLPINLIEIKLKESDYNLSFAEIYKKVLKSFQQMEKYNFSVCLGDRIESFAFAVASFYSKVPIIHIGAGDIANVPYFDTTVRHSISKISSIFFVTNKRSKEFLLQLGEEEWRILNTGHLSLCYDNLGLLKNKMEISQRFFLKEDDIVLLVTFHPSHIKNKDENFKDFLVLYKAILEAQKIFKNLKIIWTYPNNDPNYEKILAYLQKLKEKQLSQLFIEASLGTDYILTLFKNYRVIVVGNSSMGLTETPYYGIPTLNIGDRQIDRLKGDNVIDLPIDKDLIFKTLYKLIKNYDFYRQKFLKSPKRYIYGDGKGCKKAVKFLRNLLQKYSYEELLFKKTILRTCK